MEQQQFLDLDRRIRLKVPLPPTESDGLRDPVSFAEFLNAARVVIEEVLVQAASCWSSFRWLYYLRYLPNFVWEGRLATTGPYDVDLAELLTSTSTAQPTFDPNRGFELDRKIADQVMSFCAGVRFLSAIHTNLRWCGKSTRFEPSEFVIGKPRPTSQIQESVDLYDNRVSASRGLFLSGTGSLVANESGLDSALQINVMARVLSQGLERSGTIAGISTFRLLDANFEIVPVFLDELSRLNARARAQNIRWWPDEVGLLLMLLRLLTPLLDSDKATMDRAKMWGGVLMPEEKFLDISDELFDDGVKFVGQVFPGTSLPDTPAELLTRLEEDLRPSFWPIRLGSPLRREGDLIFVDIRAATVLMDQLSEFEAIGGGRKGVLRGSHFEEKVRALIDLSSWAPDEKLAKRVGTELFRTNSQDPRTDLDALGAKDGVLLLVSCKSLAKTMQYDTGDFHKVRAARTTIESAVKDLRELELEIKADPTAFDFDFVSYRKIIAIVCVPGVTYVPIGPTTEFIVPGLRAAVSTDELSRWIKEDHLL